MNAVEPIMHGRTSPAPKPFQRELALPGNSFTRFITAQAVAQVKGAKPWEVIMRQWPSDRILEAMFTRAAVAPAMTSVSGWASELAVRVTADALEALGPASAGAEVLKAGLVLNFDGAGSISAPGFVAEFGNAGWVAEGNPIPVRALAGPPALLEPHKLAAIAVLTREMLEGSNAERLISDTLMRAAGRMLDEVLFDANAGDAARPKGLRNGIATLTASNNSDPFAAAYEDVANLINAVAPVAGSGPYILVSSPGRAALLTGRFRVTGSSIRVLGSSAGTNDLLAIAPAALVAALSPTPDIETSKAATLVMDTAPGAAGTMGPEREMFQTDAMAIKMRWPITWALRDARGFAWSTPTWK